MLVNEYNSLSLDKRWERACGVDVDATARKILVVDDTQASLQVLDEMLTTHGFSIATTREGGSALTLAHQMRPDMILLDIKMPGMDGFEVCRRLKTDPQTQDIPVIFISGLHELFDKVHAFRIGAVDYITKPFQAEEILARVETHLHVRRLHDDLVAKNQDLTETLAKLQSTQQQLIESEKLAALGNLVAGIAHEINTPVGIGVTAASTLADETELLLKQYASDQFTRTALEGYLQTASRSTQLILNNLQRAADLIQSLKQVSVDQIYLERRCFALHGYMHEILRSLAPTLKHTLHRVLIDGDEETTLESYPGALSQIVTNLVINSIKHAYPTNRAGTLRFTWTQGRDLLYFTYADDGCGIPARYLNRVFDPFFTTARGSGGTGLGLHIVYNLVTKNLGGKIRCESHETGGTTFAMQLPIDAPYECPGKPN